MKARCTHCSIILESKNMVKHLRVIHKKKITSFGCAVGSCARSFGILNSLRNHCRKFHVASITEPEISQSHGDDPLPTIHEAIDSILNVDDIATVQPAPDYPDLDKPNAEPSFFETALSVASTFHGDVRLNRTQAQQIMAKFDDILNSSFMNSLKLLVLNSVDKCVVDEIDERFNDLQSSFSRLNTEYKCFSELRKRECFIEPKKITFGFREEAASGILEHRPNTGSVIPLSIILQKFFELPNVFMETVRYVSSLHSEKNVISNIMQTQFWRDRSSGKDDLVLPIFLYEDDFESGNPLGSHATVYKMSAMYVSLPCLPPRFRSKLDNIFLFQIAHSSDVDEFSDQMVYGRVINQLNSLASNGIEVNVNSKTYKLYFKLALIIGDNLGLNRILEFTTSFNTDYFCRFCKVTKKLSCKQYLEDESLIRKRADYAADVEKRDVKSTGIKKLCLWNNVTDFHVTENYCVDILHDLLEGACNYDTGFIFNAFISEERLFSLESVNFKLKYFKYPDGSNKPPLISVPQLQNKFLKMSAAEMKCFVLNCALIFGESIPRGNKYWELYLLLRQIVSLTLQQTISEGDIEILGKLIKKHHVLYVKLFGSSLKPKHHNMIHYPRIMNTVGPLRDIWTMRFEAKHRPLKQGAITSNNRINLPYTIAIKQQLHTSKIFLDRIGFENTITYEEPNICDDWPIVQLENVDCIRDYYQIKTFTAGGIRYAINTVLKLFDDKLPVYGCVKNILRKRLDSTPIDSDFAFIVQVFECVKKDAHLQSFQLIDINSYKLVQFTSLQSFEPRHMVTLSDGMSYISYDNHLQ